jgi:hypothetical protein
MSGSISAVGVTGIMHCPRSCLTTLLVLVSMAAVAGRACAFQRMLVPPVTTVSIPAFSRTEIPAFCVDADEPAPTTGDSFVKVFNAGNPEAVVVDAGGKTVPLEEAIGNGMVSVIGAGEPEKEPVRFDVVRVNNLTGNALTVRGQRPVILAGVGDPPQPGTRETQMFSGASVFSRFRAHVRLQEHGLSGSLAYDPQQDIWKKMADCRMEAEDKGISAEEFNEYTITCILR